MNERPVMQLEDVARELGLSKSTVSRAISGKGNLSQATRIRVLDFISTHNYQPNATAQQLATSKTNNIGAVLPFDACVEINTYFQTCILGIYRGAIRHNYDVLLTSVSDTDITYLKRIIARRSVDGIILMRSVIDDLCIEYLKSIDFPFLIIGTTADKDVMQIDATHKKACRELTELLLAEDNAPIGIIAGNTNYIVNINRCNGFMQAHENLKRSVDERLIFMNVADYNSACSAVEKILQRGCKTIVCGDDSICLSVLKYLDEHNLSVPNDVRLASFYDNSALEHCGITAISIDDIALGESAAEKLVDYLDNKEINDKKYVPCYEIKIRRSTKI